MELSSTIRGDYCRCLDFMKDRVKGKDGKEMVGDSQGGMTESRQKDLVDRRLFKAANWRENYTF